MANTEQEPIQPQGHDSDEYGAPDEEEAELRRQQQLVEASEDNEFTDDPQEVLKDASLDGRDKVFDGDVQKEEEDEEESVNGKQATSNSITQTDESAAPSGRSPPYLWQLALCAASHSSISNQVPQRPLNTSASINIPPAIDNARTIENAQHQIIRNALNNQQHTSYPPSQQQNILNTSNQPNHTSSAPHQPQVTLYLQNQQQNTTNTQSQQQNTTNTQNPQQHTSSTHTQQHASPSTSSRAVSPHTSPSQQTQLSLRHRLPQQQPSTSAAPAEPSSPERRRWHPRPGFEHKPLQQSKNTSAASTQTAITNPPSLAGRQGNWLHVNGQRIPLRQYTLETRPNPPLSQIIRNPAFPVELLQEIRAAAARDAAGRPVSRQASSATDTRRDVITLSNGATTSAQVDSQRSTSEDVGSGQLQERRTQRPVSTDVDRGEEEELSEAHESHPLPRSQVHDVDLGEAQDEEEAEFAELRREQQRVERSHDVQAYPSAPILVSTDVDLGETREEEQNRNNQRRPDQTTQTVLTPGSVFDQPVLHLYPIQAIDQPILPLQFLPFPLPPFRHTPGQQQADVHPPAQNHNALIRPFNFLQVFQTYGVRGSPSWPLYRERRNQHRHSENNNVESEV